MSQQLRLTDSQTPSVAAFPLRATARVDDRLPVTVRPRDADVYYGKTIWVPRSTVRYTAHGVWIPERLAMDRGLMSRRQMHGTRGKARRGWHAQLRAKMPGRTGALAVAADVA